MTSSGARFRHRPERPGLIGPFGGRQIATVVLVVAAVGLAATSGTALQGAILLVGYTFGLGLPFLLVGVLYDRAPNVLQPLVRHGRTVSFIGGMLVVAIGVAMLFDWLALLPRYFTFLSGI